MRIFLELNTNIYHRCNNQAQCTALSFSPEEPTSVYIAEHIHVDTKYIAITVHNSQPLIQWIPLLPIRRTSDVHHRVVQ